MKILFLGGINIWKSTNGGVDFNINSHWYGADGTEYVHADQHIMKFIQRYVFTLVMMGHYKTKTMVILDRY